jgi:hypothetical protein
VPSIFSGLWFVAARDIVEEGGKRQRTKQGEADEEARDARVKVTVRYEDKAEKIPHGKQGQPPPVIGRGFGILL